MCRAEVIHILNFSLNLSIKSRLISGFGLLIFIIVCFGGYFHYEMNEIIRGQNNIGQAMQKLTHSEAAEAQILSAELLALSWAQPVLEEKAALMEYVISEDEDEQQALFARFNQLGIKINKVGNSISEIVTNENLTEKIKDIQGIQNQIRSAAIEVIAAYDGEGEYGEETRHQMQLFSNKLTRLLTEIGLFQELVNEIVAEVNADILHSINKTQNTVDQSISNSELSSEVIVYIIIITLILSLITSAVIYRSITDPLEEANELANRIANFDLSSHGSNRGNLESRTDEISILMTNLYNMRTKLRTLVSNIQGTGEVLSSASVSLNGYAKDINSLSEKQLSQSSQVVDIAGSLKDDSDLIAEKASNTSKYALDADQLVKKCVENDVNNSTRAMQNVSEEMQKTRDKVNGLSLSAEKIGEIVVVINGIAEQTNLLALNAAIEAARAGEQGRGFAVVADEVRTLAERTSEATSTISEMINEVQTQVIDASRSLEESEASAGRGNSAVIEISEALHEIVVINDQLKEGSLEIANETRAQSQSATNISESLISSQVSTTGLDEDAKSIDGQATQLIELVEELTRETARFKI